MSQPLQPAELVACTAASLTESQVRELRDAVERAVTGGAGRTIVDLSSIATTTPDGVLSLLAWTSSSAPRSHGVVFAGAHGELLLTICQTRLQRDVDCYSSVDAARSAQGR